MARLIDADALLGDIQEELEYECGVYTAEQNKWIDAGLRIAANNIRRCPTVDAVPVVHGRWEQVERWATKAKYRCSVCGREIMSAVKVNIEKYPYCHCGAKMDLEVE